MKRILSMLLALIFVLGVFSLIIVADGNIKSDNPVKITAFKASENDKSYHAVDTDSIYGARMNLGAPFDGIAFCMPTNGTRPGCAATLAVYTWEGSYDATVANQPVASGRVENLQDCRTNWIYFDELDAGEYLFAIQDIANQTGTWLHSTQTYPCKVYNNSSYTDGNLELSIAFTKTPVEPFLELSKDVDIYGDYTAPEEYVIPDDSLIKTHEVMPDTWVFTDGLGRVSWTNADVGDLKEDKTVAIFYSDWHVDLAGSEPFNINNFIEEHPEAKNDYNHSGWPTSGTAYFWNEPIWGYYRTDDAWVLRKQAELLANAGIDTIFTDNTNGNFTWRKSYTAIYETWSKAMDDGVMTPKVSYMLPFAPTSGNKEQIESIFLDVYRPNKYQKLWFYWEGKPMLMGYNSNFSKSTGLGKEIINTFTWRTGQPAYVENNPAYRSWGWLSRYPQTLYYKSNADRKNNIVEQVTVGVAQNSSYTQNIVCTAMNGEGITGRSYTTKDGYHTEENAKLYGYNLSEQFEYAISVNPKMIFVTGWNEWTAGRQQEWGGVKNAFADQFNDEFSRDIEPSKGDLKDYYYYLLVNYVRKYKGARAIPTPTVAKTVDVSASSAQWDDVGPYFAAYIGNANNRDNAQGYGSMVYSDYSGRNDIIGAKVARDGEYVYFYVECNDDITPYTDNLWMNLYIDTDADGRYNGWESFDYIIGKTQATADKVVLERFTGNGYESVKVAECDYKVDGKTMQIKVKKQDLGLTGYDFTINFAWTDNVHDAADEGVATADGVDYLTFTGDILDFYTSGDVAPGGRFKYSFVSTQENAVPGSGETTAEETQPSETEAQTDSETTAAATDAQTSAAETQSGCCGLMLAGVAPLALIVIGAVILKKKEN